MITVTYDGDYPVACMGQLEVFVDGEKVYSKVYCCTSHGSVWFDDDWNEHVTGGPLTWDDADDFSPEIQAAVAEKLSEISVCCGGCV